VTFCRGRSRERKKNCVRKAGGCFTALSTARRTREDVEWRRAEWPTPCCAGEYIAIPFHQRTGRCHLYPTHCVFTHYIRNDLIDWRAASYQISRLTYDRTVRLLVLPIHCSALSPTLRSCTALLHAHCSNTSRLSLYLLHWQALLHRRIAPGVYYYSLLAL